MGRKGQERPCRICGKPVSSWGDNRDVHPECADPTLRERNKSIQNIRRAKSQAIREGKNLYRVSRADFVAAGMYLPGFAGT